VRILMRIVAIAAAAAWSAAPVKAMSDPAPLLAWFAEHSEPPDRYVQNPGSTPPMVPAKIPDVENDGHPFRPDPRWLELLDPGQHVGVGDNQVPRDLSPRTADRKFWTLASAHVGLLLADTAVSLALTHRCPRCKESDPYTAPIIDAGPKAAYPAAIAFGAGMVSLSWWMKREHTAFRWWMLPAAIAAGNAWCIASNLRYWNDAAARK
jgi:hypothetical protein